MQEQGFTTWNICLSEEIKGWERKKKCQIESDYIAIFVQ